MEYDLFNPYSDQPSVQKYSTYSTSPLGIEGLTYTPEYLTREEEVTCEKAINAALWLNDIKRRVQHYGWKYDYKARTILPSMYLGPLPSWAGAVATKLYLNGHSPTIADQLIVNEYQPGQGIAHHIDCEPCFGENIVSISLSSSCVMEFINVHTKEKKELLLQPRSLLVLQGPARHEWTHGIPARKSDYWDSQKLIRSCRTSMTFRQVAFKKTIGAGVH